MRREEKGRDKVHQRPTEAVKQDKKAKDRDKTLDGAVWEEKGAKKELNSKRERIARRLQEDRKRITRRTAGTGRATPTSKPTLQPAC